MYAHSDVVRAAFALVGLHTQKAQAEAIGVHENTIGRMYQGFPVHRLTALSIARVTGRSVSDLFSVVPDAADAGELVALAVEPNGTPVGVAA